MRYQTYILKGKAQVENGGLRCAAPREDRPGWICNRLIVRKNRLGQIAGEFKCERCSQIVEVKSEPIAETTQEGK